MYSHFRMSLFINSFIHYLLLRRDRCRIETGHLNEVENDKDQDEDSRIGENALYNYLSSTTWQFQNDSYIRLWKFLNRALSGSKTFSA